MQCPSDIAPCANRNMKFTDTEMEIIQEMVGFPDTYITTKEADTIETILKKPETINKQK